MVGLDLAAHMVERAGRNAAHAGLDGRGFWPQGDGHHLPFADGSFQLVMSSFALHHWADPLSVFNEIARVLAPSGRYYIADLCREVSRLQRFFAYASIPVISLPSGSYRGYGGYYESVRASRTADELRSLLDRSRLPPGAVVIESTRLVPIVTLATKVA
jgi:ubiquinone/menaquinone biosynthesis C-methylase UbiE